MFKVSLFLQGLTTFLGVDGESDKTGEGGEGASEALDEAARAEEKRGKLILDVARIVRVVTQSLFRPYKISCKPVECVASTHGRLMAGYLLHYEGDGVASLAYCELHCHSGGQSKLMLYENEFCEVVLANIWFNEDTSCCERVGVDCSSFCVEDHQFAARTFEERKLWLRALSNVKVKLRNGAPSPTREELYHYRQAIQEHAASAVLGSEARAPTDPLLERCRRRHTSSAVCSQAATLVPPQGEEVDGGADAGTGEPGTARIQSPAAGTGGVGGSSPRGARVPEWALTQSGTIHALLVVGACGPGRKEALDSVLRIERWCEGCGVADVTLLALPASKELSLIHI